MTKQLAGYGIAIMTTLLALVVLWQFRMVLIYVLISLALAAVLRPLVKRLAWQSLAGRIAWIFLYLAALAGFSLILFLTANAAIHEIQLLVRTVSVRDAWVLPVWLQGGSFEVALLARLPPPSIFVEAVSGDQGQLVLPALLGFMQNIGVLVTGIFVILFLSIYWGINQIHFERLWLSLLPSSQRKQARDIWRIVETDTGAYIRSQLLLSLLAGLLLGIGFWILGSPYPALLALAGAFASLVPVVGAVLFVIPPLLVGLLTSVQLSLVTVLYAFVVLIILGIWVRPRLFDRMWNNPVLTVVLLIALADVFGLIGIIVAPPLSVIIQILWKHLVSHRVAAGASAQISDLKERLAHLQETVSTMEESQLPLLTSSLQRISNLILEAEPVLLAASPDNGENSRKMDGP